MNQKIDPKFMRKYIDETRELRREYDAIETQFLSIYEDTANGKPAPANVEDLTDRSEYLRGELAAKAILLADFLDQVLSQRITE